MGVITFLPCVAVAGFLVAITAHQIYRFAPEHEGGKAVRAEWPWFAKGCALPALVWMLMNVGLSFQLQPFMPSVQHARNAGGPWVGTFLAVVGTGWLLIASYWSAVTVSWLLVRMARALEDAARTEFRALCLTCLAGAALPALWLIWLGGWHTVGFGALLVGLPIAGYGKNIVRRPPRRPMYARAIARMKFGKYTEAEWEIIRQLEHAETDFDGWLMLAELYANQFRDLSEAEQIILEICDQPQATPSEISVALHKLADWQLAVGNDPEAAARTLECIKSRLPNTHLARMAELRRAQLPRNREELQAQRQPRHIPLPASNEAPDTAIALPTPEQATARLEQLRQQLTRDPNNPADREQFARLLAEPLGQAAAALEQLELLVALPDQPDAKRAQWLSLMADWQWRLLQDEAAARETWERIIRDFTATPQAFAAQRRISLLKAEAAARKAR